jgi:hypothetical protein
VTSRSRRKKSVKKLASLSALGAGALTLGAGDAKANVVFTTIVPNAQVGFNNASANHFSTSFLQHHVVHEFGLFTVSGAQGVGGHEQYFRMVSFEGGNLSFAKSGSHLRVFSSGQTWNGAGGGAEGLVASRRFNTAGTMRTGGTGSVTNEYAMFRFSNGSGGYNYGWLNFSVLVSPGIGFSGTLGPNVTLYSFAYDTDGVALAAGSQEPVPEPSNFALTGLGALALGAVGVRRWRAAKRTA